MRSRVYATVGRPSVRPSGLSVRLTVCPIWPRQAVFAAVGPEAKRYRSIDRCTAGGPAVSSSRAAARRAAANAGSATLSADAGS